MHPALSVIFFTSLSGAGYGLLFWSALATLGGRVHPWSLWIATMLAVVLVTAGLLSSMLHLGKPARAWRAFSQWRTSWLSREGLAALATYVPALMFGLLAFAQLLDVHDGTYSIPLNLLSVMLCIVLLGLSITTIVCTAMIYASLKPIPAWGHRLVVPGYLLFALLTGGLLLMAIDTYRGTRFDNGPAMVAVVFAVALWILKRRYWRDIDVPLPATRGDAVGLPQRQVSVFERPHTEANYLIREMAFVVARKHAKRMRLLAVALFAVVPILCMLPVWLFVHLDAAPWFAIAAISAVAGAFVERWLFFAEAKHMVTLYY